MATLREQLQLTLQKLEAARTLLSQSYCRGAYARDADGNRCSVTADYATCFCSAGALARVNDIDLTDKLPEELSIPGRWELRVAADQLFSEGAVRHMGVTQVNDYDGRDAALAVFDRAIVNTRAKLTREEVV